MSSGVPQFHTQYLNDYLTMVEDTESPRIFHIWSALFAVSSALGRRCWLPFGTFDIYPNQYILLVGTPGTRKTTAANQGKRVLKASTGVRFAPPDTGGQRQGLIAEMADTGGDSREFVGSAELGDRNAGLLDFTDFENVSNDPADAGLEHFVDSADKHHLALVGSEFSRLVGQNNGQMLDFLGEMYDGEDVWYRTKQSKIQLKNCLLNLIACTTPVHINNSLPPAAAGQGFLSRMILVYGARKYKMVPWPSAPDHEVVTDVKNRLHDVYYNLSGAFDMTPAAKEYATSLYGYVLDIPDSRFGYYNERRFTHLCKLAMALAAVNQGMTIHVEDFEEAHRILRATEKGMPDALGEFGLNPLAMLKQELLEQLRTAQGPMTMEQLVAMFHRDARSHEITEVVNDLIRMKLIKTSTSKTGSHFLSSVYSKANTEDAMMKLLAEG